MQYNKIWKDFLELPPEAQKEVEDFIAFLKRYFNRNLKGRKQNMSAWRKEPFIGLWRDRHNMKNSIKWIRKIRRKHWK